MVRGQFVVAGRSGELAADIIAKADAGFKWQASIGANAGSIEEVKAGSSVEVNGRTYAGPVRVARNVVIREVSFVVLGADRKTSALVARNRTNNIKGAAMDFQQWLINRGFGDMELTDMQRGNLQELYDMEYAEDAENDANDMPADPADNNAAATTDSDPMTNDPIPQANAAARPVQIRATANQTIIAERNRIDAINAHATTYEQTEIAAQAIAEGWTPEQAAIKMLRATRPTGPNVIVKHKPEGENLLHALQAAFAFRMGLPEDHRAYNSMAIRASEVEMPKWITAGINTDVKQRTLEAGLKMSSQSLVDFARMALQASGQKVPTNREEMIRAAFSSASLGNVMTTSVNALLMMTYLDFPDSTEGWCAVEDVNDYKQNERPRILKGQNLEILPEDGTANHDTAEDVVEYYKVDRYAKQFMVDEIAIVNDNLSGIQTKVRDMGQAAGRLRPDLVYYTLMSNPTLNSTSRALFNGTDGNLITSSALAFGTLSTATSTMLAFRENGVNIDVTPTHIIVPPALRDTARVLIGSQNTIIAGTAGSVTTTGNANPHLDWNLQLVTDPRLQNGVNNPKQPATNQGGSTTTWYLASQLMPALAVGYISGRGRAPRVRSWTLSDRGQYGQGWDVEHSVGVCVRDWKGMLRATA